MPKLPQRCAIALVTGACSGGVSVVVRRTLQVLQWLYTQRGGMLPEAATALPAWRRAGTPVLGAALALLTLAALRRWTRNQPVVEYVEAIRRNEKIPFRTAVERMASAALNLGSGAAVGREGAMMQFSTACLSRLADRKPAWFGEPRMHLTYALAGAVAGVYRSPLAAVFFALELGRGSLDWMELVPCMCASGAGWLVSIVFLKSGPLFPVSVSPAVTMQGCLLGVVTGVALTLFAPLYYRLLRGARILRKFPLALVVSGLLVGLLSLWRVEVWGNGDAALTAIAGLRWPIAAVLLVIALRLLATSVCVGAGAIGGVFTPTVFLGAAVGYAFAQSALPHLGGITPPAVAFCVVAGIAALLAAVTHAPCMSACMAVELTGGWRALPFVLLLCWIAAKVSCRLEPRSLYGVATGAPVSLSAKEDSGR